MMVSELLSKHSQHLDVIVKSPNQFVRLNKQNLWSEHATLEMKSCSLIERVVLFLHKLDLFTVSKRNLQDSQRPGYWSSVKHTQCPTHHPCKHATWRTVLLLFKQTFKIGSARSSGSNMTDLEQTLNEPLILLEGKQVI